MFVAHRNCAIPYCQVVMLSTWDSEDSEIESHQEATNCQQQIFTLKFCKYEVLTTQNTVYLLQVEERFHIFTENRTQNLCVGRQFGVPLWYQCVVLLYFIVEVSLFIERTDYRSNVAKTILFENCSCFSKIPFSISNLPGYFRVSFRFPQVTEFGKSTANRRRSTWPILFVNITQPCDQHDRKIPTIRKSAARWRGRRVRGYIACEFAICS